MQMGNDAPGHGIMEYFKESNVDVSHAKLFDGVDTGI